MQGSVQLSQCTAAWFLCKTSWQFNAIQCSGVQCSVLQCLMVRGSLRDGAIVCVQLDILYSSAVQGHMAVEYSAVRCNAVQCCSALWQLCVAVASCQSTLRSVVSYNRHLTCAMSRQREVAEAKFRAPTVYDCVPTHNALVYCGIGMSTLPSTLCGYSWTGLPVVRRVCSFVKLGFEHAKHSPMCPSLYLK